MMQRSLGSKLLVRFSRFCAKALEESLRCSIQLRCIITLTRISPSRSQKSDEELPAGNTVASSRHSLGWCKDFSRRHPHYGASHSESHSEEDAAVVKRLQPLARSPRKLASALSRSTTWFGGQT